MKMRWFACTCALLAGCAGGSINLGQPEGSPVRLGATVAEARQALHTSAATERSGIDASGQALRLGTSGIEVFFDATGVARTVRLHAPFAAAVLGVRIGDDATSILAKRGQPLAKNRASGQTGYTYHPDEITILTYIVGEDQRVESIFLER